ncbi:MAG: tetratricopeptide repeat protein [Candidatus Latescibacterota bacterium]|nr:MAG: tetratricopeptide repeat protein [Candidatus Latescibacterota bacterium]
MKICPFISHLLGDDNSNTLTLNNRGGDARDNDDSNDVVILGYNDGDGSNVQTDVMTKTESHTSTHVECLKESCRFYHKNENECRFDIIFSKLNEMKSGKDHTAQLSRLATDIDKIWSFQTKGVAEIVESLADSEKNQSSTIDRLRAVLDERFESLVAEADKQSFEKVQEQINALSEKLDSFDTDRDDQPFEKVQEQINALSEKLDSFDTDRDGQPLEKVQEQINALGEKLDSFDTDRDGQPLEKVQEQINTLGKKLEDRDEELKDLSGTMSEFVSNLDGTVSDIRAISDDVMKQVKEMSRALPDEETLKEMVAEAFGDKGNSLTAFDITTPMKALELKIEDLQKQQEDSTAGVEKKLLTSIQNQKELEGQLDSWKEGLDATVADIKSLRDEWETRIEELVENNKKISGYIEEGTKHREDAQSRLNKKESRKFNNLGVTSFHNGAYEMARDQFLKAVDLDPDFAEAYNNLGLAFTELDMEEKATDAFSRAVELNPSLHAAYNNLGYIHYKQGDYAQAVELYNEALGRNTKNGPAYTNLGNAYYKLNRMDEARDAWTRALELDPGNEKARRNLERIGKDND